MKKLPVPENEIEIFIELIKSRPYLFDENYIKTSFVNQAKTVIHNPFSEEIIQQISNCINRKIPMSVIRLGDGEMNLLTFTQYPSLPQLSYITAKESINKREHSFIVNKSWLFIFEQMMFTALKEADVVGVLGMWRPNLIDVDKYIKSIHKNIRGRWGQWAGLDYFQNISKKNLLANKTVASAHLYFSVIQNLKTLFSVAGKVYLITNQNEILNKLSMKYPLTEFILINEPISNRPLKCAEPSFLYRNFEKLPQDLSGTLSLIGAGPWSEFYCTWIKRRGGVAVDIGSGFNLLLGKKLRPVHSKININIE